MQTFAWGQDISWTPVKVTRSYRAAEGLQAVVLDIGQLALGYQRGGQFLQLKVGKDAKPGFYAIASAPDVSNKGLVELLVKNSGESAEALCAAPEGMQPSQRAWCRPCCTAVPAAWQCLGLGAAARGR